MSSTIHRLVVATCGLLTLTASQNALALDKYIDLEPPQTKSGYGYGYNSISREFVLRQCVQFAPGVIEGGSGASGDDFRFSSIISNAQLADEMDLSVSTKFSASMGVASASSSAKVDFFQKTKTNFLTHTILASYNNVEPMKYIGGDITLKPEYLAKVGTPEFRAQCGDYVIIGEQQGRWYFGTVQLSVKDTTTESKLAAGGTVDASYATMSASASVNTLNKMKEASSTQDLLIRVTSSGTSSASLTIDQFLAQVQAFPGANGPKQTYKLKAVPYEAIVANWPATDPLAPMTSAQKLTKVAEAAWGLTALIADSEFVLQNAKLFALGTTPAKRDARLAHIKARRNWYQAQLDGMRSSAKNCDVDWNGSPTCESLYNQWKDFEEFAVAEYDQFPIRYVSDCYGARDVSDQIQDTLKMAISAERGQWSNTKGDREVGGGPVGFSAHLKFAPDFTGGDPLAVRKLRASLATKVHEMKADDTTFESNVKIPVYDLSKPDLSGGAPTTMNQCSYKGTGVKVTEVTESTAACDPLKPVKAAYDQCVQAIESQKYHGILRAKTGEDPRTETFSKNGKGALGSMKCTVDAESDNDTKFIGCDAIGLRTIQLDLVNSQDIVADGWVAPPTPIGVTIAKGIKDTGAYLGLVQSLAAPKKKLKKLLPLPGKGRDAACKPGLVLVDGECVPQLKR